MGHWLPSHHLCPPCSRGPVLCLHLLSRPPVHAPFSSHTSNSQHLTLWQSQAQDLATVVLLEGYRKV
jgi:hypothetical protein